MYQGRGFRVEGLGFLGLGFAGTGVDVQPRVSGFGLGLGFRV